MSDAVINNNLAQAMRDALNSTALKAGALKEFSELAERAEKLQAAAQTWEAETMKLRRELQREKVTRTEMEAHETEMTAREHAVSEREQKMAELEKSGAVSRARADVYAECFNLVFRNSQVHRKVTSEVMQPQGEYGQQWGATQTLENNETTEER